MRANHAILCLLIVFLVISCGCFTLEVHSKVNADATVSSYSIDLKTSQFVYNALKNSAKEQGYATVRESFQAQSEPGVLTYNEVWDGDTVTISMASTRPIQSLDPENWQIRKEGGYMIYDDKRFSSDEAIDDSNEFTEAMLGSVGLHYYLEMPGKIVETNANAVDGNRAEWHLTGSEMFTTNIYAKSEVPALGIPGFGPLAALAGLCCAVLVAFRKKA
jgi:PGF-CTERM protein